MEGRKFIYVARKMVGLIGGWKAKILMEDSRGSAPVVCHYHLGIVITISLAPP